MATGGRAVCVVLDVMQAAEWIAEYECGNIFWRRTSATGAAALLFCWFWLTLENARHWEHFHTQHTRETVILPKRYGIWLGLFSFLCLHTQRPFRGKSKNEADTQSGLWSPFLSCQQSRDSRDRSGYVRCCFVSFSPWTQQRAAEREERISSNTVVTLYLSKYSAAQLLSNSYDKNTLWKHGFVHLILFLPKMWKKQEGYLINWHFNCF